MRVSLICLKGFDGIPVINIRFIIFFIIHSPQRTVIESFADSRAVFFMSNAVDFLMI